MLSSASRLRARGAVVVSLFVVAAMAAACGAAASSAAPAGPGGAPAATGGGGPLSGGNGSGGGSGQGNGGQGSGNGNGQGEGEGDPGVIDQAGLLIIKDGALAIQVTGLDAAIDAAAQQISDLGGYASASNRSGDGDDAQASVTFRIPVARWEDALSGLRGLGEKVIDERYSTDEVTAQVVDLDARISNLRASETAVQGFMDRAVDLDDVLTVQHELTRIRGEIEQLTAQKTNLEGRAAFSTLIVTFALKQDPILAEQEGFDAATEVEAASATLISMLQGVATAGIWFGIVWLPVLVTMAALTLLGVAIWRRFLSRAAGGEESPLPSAGTGA
jgi:hypothetical protein